MPKSPETRIYEAVPTAPTPSELRDAIGLLVNEYGRAGSHELFIKGIPQNPIDRHFVKFFHYPQEGNYAGFLVYNRSSHRNRTASSTNGELVEELHIIDLERAQSVALAYSDGTFLLRGGDDETRKEFGGMILRAWNTLAKHDEIVKPSKR